MIPQMWGSAQTRGSPPGQLDVLTAVFLALPSQQLTVVQADIQNLASLRLARAGQGQGIMTIAGFEGFKNKDSCFGLRG